MNLASTKARAVIFDLDGTLLDTLEDIADAANRVLAAKGFPMKSLDVHRVAVGYGARTLMAKVLPENQRTQEMIQQCFTAFREDYGAHWNVKTKPYPGVPELLDTLQSMGIKMAVLSNKPADFTRKCVDGILRKWKFEAVIGGEDGIPSKPDPAGALEIARRLDIPPEEFVYLGDTDVDIQTARAAGMFPIGAVWGFRRRDELEREGAKVLLERPQDLAKLLK